MEKRLESLPTTIPGLLLTARDIYRDLGLSKEERDEQIEILKLLSVEELRNYVITQIYLHMQRYSQKSTDPPSTAADVVKLDAVAGNTRPSRIATGDDVQAATSGGVAVDSPIAPPVGAPEPTAHHTPGSGASRFKLFYNQ
jgi:hypothetical protein